MKAKANLIKERLKKAREILSSCRLCGHRCGVNRFKGEIGKCGAAPDIEVASYCPHHGEEPFLSGEKGSGTVFFSKCTMKCVYCQNWEISQPPSPCPPLVPSTVRLRSPLGAIRGRKLNDGELAKIMLELQCQGCHNINLVSPTHFMPQILWELGLAFEKGLEVPIVYNTNGYDSVELLNLLDGIIDIYLPDLKYFDNEKSKKYSEAEDYVETAKAGIKEMFRQVGNMRFDQNEIAVRGVLVRHLVLPSALSDSAKAIKYLSTVSRELWISIMSQYSPQNRAGEYKELSRELHPEEYWEAVKAAQDLKMENYLIQELESRKEFLPDFKRENPFLP